MLETGISANMRVLESQCLNHFFSNRGFGITFSVMCRVSESPFQSSVGVSEIRNGYIERCWNLKKDLSESCLPYGV